MTEPLDIRMERKLHRLASLAEADDLKEEHVNEALLALLRGGDLSDDLNDAISHVAACSVCRARLTEGRVLGRSMVVVTIEAPPESSLAIERVAEGAHARLFERGKGRWTAVVDAARVDDLTGGLEKPEGSQVTRLGVGAPFDVPVEDLRGPRLPMASSTDLAVEAGTDAAEVQAWAKAARTAPKYEHHISPVWLTLGLVAIAVAVAVAYLLASR